MVNLKTIKIFRSPRSDSTLIKSLKFVTFFTDPHRYVLKKAFLSFNVDQKSLTTEHDGTSANFF